MKRCILILTLMMIFAGSYAQVAIQTFTLDNGLQVWLHEDHSRPEIFGCVVINGGAKLDEEHATGMAHYLEHMLFKGTQHLGTVDYEKEKFHLDKIDSLYEELGKTTDKALRQIIQLAINEQNRLAAEFAVPNETDRLLASIGGRGVNAFTSHDMVVYHNVFPPHQTEKWLEIYSHRFVNPVFRLFQSELETVYEEKNRAMDNMGYQLLTDFNANFYKQHPYGQRDVLGTVEHLKNPSLITMYNYFNTYYVPNNMALVLSGDFNAEEIKPIIEAKFSTWKSKPLPPQKEYQEADFKGTEVMRGRYVPIKVGVMGYRTVPLGHPDETALEVISNLLSNGNQTGLWDKLSLDNKLLVADMQSDMEVDYGKTMLFFAPKIIGQSLKKAESLVMDQLEKLKKGDFSDEFLESVKLNMLRDYQLRFESNYSKAMMMAEAFVTGQDWNQLLAKEAELKNIDKASILKVANQYYADNRLVLYSRAGFPKKTKLDKPPFTPVTPKGIESEYAKEFKQLPNPLAKPRYVDMQNDVSYIQQAPLVEIYKSENSLNEIFTIQLEFGKGSLSDARLEMLSTMLSNAGAADVTRDELKKQFSNLGTTYSFFATDLTFIINLRGFDQYFDQSLQLLGKLLDAPEFNEKGRKAYLSNIKFERKIERKDVNEKAYIIREYMMYGKGSSYLNRLSKSQIKQLPFKELTDVLKEVRQHQLVVFYTGKQSLEQVQKSISGSLLSITPTKEAAKEARPFIKFAQPTIYFINDKKAVQTQMNLFINSELSRDPNKQVAINSFNEYFGGNMGGLVFQEIREFRSLAYSASARLNNGSIYGTPAYMSGFIGCQADKTVEAIEVMSDLITNLPKKEDRLPDIRNSLLQASAMNRPYFRSFGQTVHNWKKHGYVQDPNIRFNEAYQELSFDTILMAHTEFLSGKHIHYAIVGNKKRIDINSLNEKTKVQELKLSDIRVK